LKTGTVRLAPQDTKGGEHRILPMTARVKEVLSKLPRHLLSDYVFPSPATGRPWRDLDRKFAKACRAAGLDGLWFHDLRRSFVTNARKRGVPESVIMKLSGHRTREVFDRYNIVNEDDLRDAVRLIEASGGHDLDTLRPNASMQ